MSVTEYAICPICKKEVLLPFSICANECNEIKEKTYGSWVCTNCGFCISTGDSKASNPKHDITAVFLNEFAIKIEELRKVYYKKGNIVK
ncbi:MAG: hypothetical protein IAX21_07145 [Candidatus Bathyarchaeota archaeon]|nr:MAG: hypothetical protein NUK63_10280 [Candidatus Bathyarchaeum tardum]WNZ28436.1 MAG: hypothetical protein IAX21_07145 [Candidatus Bathyarchaeota archaeon]